MRDRRKVEQYRPRYRNRSEPMPLDLEKQPWDDLMPPGVNPEMFAIALERWLWHEDPNLINEALRLATEDRSLGAAVLLVRNAKGDALGFRFKEVTPEDLMEDMEPMDGKFICTDLKSERDMWEAVRRDRRSRVSRHDRASEEPSPRGDELPPRAMEWDPGDSFEDLDEKGWTRN